MGKYPIQARIAATIAVLLVAVALATMSLATLPVAQDHWSEQPWVLAVVQSSIFLLEGVTALLLIALAIRTFALTRETEIRAATFGEQAHRDGLTGLYNRRYLTQRLDEELKRARRTATPLSLLILDIDHFKRINDTYGHLAGDDCLVALAEALDGRVQRAGDFTARYGGEEFVVVLPNTDAKAARVVAEEIRGLVQMLHGKGQSPHPMTVSVGVATALGAESLNVQDLIAAADCRLYAAKNLGRNRVVADGAPTLVVLSESA